MYIAVEATRWVWEQSRSERSARLVLLAIAAHCNDDGYCWPGMDALVRYTKLSMPAVLKAREEVEKLGEITVEKGGKGATDTNRYYLKSFMESRVKKGKENTDKGKDSGGDENSSFPQGVGTKELAKRELYPSLPEEEVNKNLEEAPSAKINLVLRAIEESHRTGESADEIIRRARRGEGQAA